MEEKKASFQTVDEYISLFPSEVQEKLQMLRALIKDTAPEAIEKISWRMPTYDLYGNLVHFAAHAKHIGFYPSPSGIENFKERLSEYKNSKGAVQFLVDQPLPMELIREIVSFRVAENKMKAQCKKTK